MNKPILGTIALSLALVSTGGATHAAAPFELQRASGASPFAPNCNGAAQTGINYPNAEVEPWITVNPRNPNHVVSVWQQDRWSNGGSNGLLTGVSLDGGSTWQRSAAKFTRCSGGTVANHGDYERASDPWVSFAPDGTLHQISLSFDDSDGNQAILVSRSTDGGLHWSNPIELQRDTSFDIGLDKEAITADPNNSRYVYAVWDRLTDLLNPDPTQYTGPTWFSRSTDGGATWEPARNIYDPGRDSQTIANQIAVLPDGTLINVMVSFILFDSPAPQVNVVVLRSTNRGVTWSAPIIVNSLQAIGVVDPQTGHAVRTGDTIPDIAVDAHSGAVYVSWQDSRFSAGARDGIVLSKSTDGGRTWSEPVQVNKARRAQAFTGSVDVNTDGVVAVTYYDFRHDTRNPNTLLTNYWLATSRDGGRTFSETPVGGSFDMSTAPDALGYFVGDYEGLAHAGDAFLPFFVRANSGNPANRTDAFVAVNSDMPDASEGGFTDVNTHRASLRALIASHRARHH